MKTICSTKILAKRDGTFFHKQDIFPEGLVTEMYVVSAYTDVKAIEWLVGELKTPNRCDQRNRIVLKVYLDERYSRFDDQNMRKYLLKIDKLIQSATKANGNSLFSPDSGIFLVKKGSLFHSKLIITKTNQHQRIIIGSLNFTNNALNSNEELVCIRDDDNTFYNQSCNYINSLNSLGEQENYNVQGGNERPNIYVHKVSKSLTISHEKPATLDDYLSSGYLVHPAKKRQLPLYFNLKLPKDVVERELENVENSDLFSGKGVKQSISILLMMKKIAEQKHLKLDVATVKGNDSGKWKSLCIDTPLGMWCPGEKIEELNKKIASVEAIRNHTIVQNKNFLFINRHNSQN